MENLKYVRSRLELKTRSNKPFHYLAVSFVNWSKHDKVLMCLLAQRHKDLSMKTNQTNPRGCVLYRIPYPLQVEYHVKETIPTLPSFERLDFVMYENI